MGEQITAFCAGKDYALIAAGNGEYAFYDLGANRISSGNLTQNCDFALFSGEYTLLANRSELQKYRWQGLTDTARQKNVLQFSARLRHYKILCLLCGQFFFPVQDAATGGGGGDLSGK